MAKNKPNEPGKRLRGREPVENLLRERIQTRIYTTGQRLPSERELSKEFGVSRASVQAAIKSLVVDGYVCQVHNRRPVVSESAYKEGREPQPQKFIAVWIQPNLQDYGATTILDGIREATEPLGCALLVGFPNRSTRAEAQKSEIRFLEMVSNHPQVIGSIIWLTDAPNFSDAYNHLSESGKPVVFIDREPPMDISADVVSVQNRRGARTAVEHLVSLGHRRIAMITNREDVSSVRERIAGYTEALPPESGYPRIYDYCPETMDEDPSSCLEFVRQIFSEPEPPTAFFCVNDNAALRMQRALGGLGIEVPRDVSLVGFDWACRALPYGGDLTTIAQPFEQIGKTAAERLLDLADTAFPQPARHILLEASLVVRSTTAAPTLSSFVGAAHAHDDILH